MTNKDKFLVLVSSEDPGTLERNSARIRNRAMLRESQQIALKVLIKLDELGWLQKDLAKAMDVSSQQITKIVSGKENLTIETQIKLQNILNIPVLASFYENKMLEMEEWIVTTERRVEKIVAQTNQFSDNYQGSKIIKLGRTTTFEENHQKVG